MNTESRLWNFLDQKKVPWKMALQDLKKKYPNKDGRIVVTDALPFFSELSQHAVSFEYIYGEHDEHMPITSWVYRGIPLVAGFDFSNLVLELEKIFGPRTFYTDADKFQAVWEFDIAELRLSYEPMEKRKSSSSFAGATAVVLAIRTGYRPDLTEAEHAQAIAITKDPSLRLPLSAKGTGGFFEYPSTEYDLALRRKSPTRTSESELILSVAKDPDTFIAIKGWEAIFIKVTDIKKIVHSRTTERSTAVDEVYFEIVNSHRRFRLVYSDTVDLKAFARQVASLLRMELDTETENISG